MLAEEREICIFMFFLFIFLLSAALQGIIVTTFDTLTLLLKLTVGEDYVYLYNVVNKTKHFAVNPEPW